MNSKVIIAVSVLCLLIALYYEEIIYNYFQVTNVEFMEKSTQETDQVLFTEEELKLYNGIDRPELYLAILGLVFDVTKGADHYGPGKSYNFFVGRDGSRSFITGEFNKPQGSDEVLTLTDQDLVSIKHWVDFYNKDYTKVGKLIGRFYQENGKLTKYGSRVKRTIKFAENRKESQDSLKLQFPPCNIEWDHVRGSHVWCTNKSGGIQRSWVGVPRQYFEPGTKNHRCACVEPTNTDLQQLKEYEGCDSGASSCFIKEIK